MRTLSLQILIASSADCEVTDSENHLRHGLLRSFDKGSGRSVYIDQLLHHLHVSDTVCQVVCSFDFFHFSTCIYK